jgi:hypothetical protein
MRNQKFLDLCDAQIRITGKERWTLSLAKVPQDVLTDGTMRHVMGDFARDVANKTAYAANDYIEDVEARSHIGGIDSYEGPGVPLAVRQRAQTFGEYAEGGRAYDEYRETFEGAVEYRIAEFPLALGESIMMNHALFAGLLHAGATPITDDRFHSQALTLKLEEAAALPEVQTAQAERARQMKTDLLALATLTDKELHLPILSPAMPLDEVLEYRRDHESDLRQAREKLASMARRIEGEPWTNEFAQEIDRKTIPDIAQELEEVRKARDSWLAGDKGKRILSAAGVVLGAAGAVLTAVLAPPLTPLPLVAAGLSFAAGSAIPAVQWVREGGEAKQNVQANGLHYLLTS